MAGPAPVSAALPADIGRTISPCFTRSASAPAATCSPTLTRGQSYSAPASVDHAFWSRYTMRRSASGSEHESWLRPLSPYRFRDRARVGAHEPQLAAEVGPVAVEEQAR